jgi:1,4-alpha-glucan branching enzyme
MTALAGRRKQPTEIEERALRLAGNELMLAQASDWPFMLRNGASPDFARKQVEQHLARFHETASQLESGRVDRQWLEHAESRDTVFPALDWRYWVAVGGK